MYAIEIFRKRLNRIKFMTLKAFNSPEILNKINLFLRFFQIFFKYFVKFSKKKALIIKSINDSNTYRCCLKPRKTIFY